MKLEQSIKELLFLKINTTAELSGHLRGKSPLILEEFKIYHINYGQLEHPKI